MSRIWSPLLKHNKLSTIKNLLTMAFDRTTHGCGTLAESILQVCLQKNLDLSTKELKITFDILRKLVSEVKMEVRRTIAECLATRGDLLHDIALFLANDQIGVAYPVLMDGNALIKTQSIDVINSLLRNPTAQIGRETMAQMVEMSRTMTPI